VAETSLDLGGRREKETCRIPWEGKSLTGPWQAYKGKMGSQKGSYEIEYHVRLSPRRILGRGGRSTPRVDQGMRGAQQETTRSRRAKEKRGCFLGGGNPTQETRKRGEIRVCGTGGKMNENYRIATAGGNHGRETGSGGGGSLEGGKTCKRRGDPRRPSQLKKEECKKSL